jgi:hypothetical protein
MTTRTDFRVRALPERLLERVRGCEPDASGNPAERVRASGGEPVRCCLRDARPGEDLLLLSYEPPIPPGPYVERGAVFVHARPCLGPLSEDRYPREWYGRPQVLRSYDRRGWIRDAQVHDGRQPEAVLSRLLADPEVVQVHSRNVAYGCFMFQVVRAAPVTPPR